jgi:hypothetical protein
MYILTRTFISNSYFQGDLVEPILLHVYLFRESLFFWQLILKKYGVPGSPQNNQ